MSSIGLWACPQRTAELPTATLVDAVPAYDDAAAGDPTATYLADNADRYRRAIARGRAWLDGMTADPIALRTHGIKGKKKLVELFDSYVRLHAIAPPAERPPLLARMKEVAAVTYTDAYHDMLTIDDRQFKQDATSYLRAAFLMERAGLDTTRYRAEIARVHPRLNEHMRTRGSHQRMSFHRYYAHFGLTEPFDLEAAFQSGIIAARHPPQRFRDRDDAYALTHEIFVPYGYGEKLDADYFDADDRAYLRGVLDVVTSYYVMVENADLVAELVSCLRYVRMTDLPVYTTALDYLLTAQRDDGTWGSYEKYRERYGAFVDQAYYLHTTAVAIDALTIAFHTPVDR